MAFTAHYLCIFLDGEKVFRIAHEADESDYSWVLEECSDKKPYEKVVVGCEGTEIFAHNILNTSGGVMAVKQVITSDELLANQHFVRWFLMMNFPEGISAEGCSVFELIEENCTLDTVFIDHLTGYYEGVLEENDGYVDTPKRVIIPLDTGDEFCVEFHPGDTIYFMNGNEIGCTGGHYKIRKLSLEQFLMYTAHMQECRKLFLLPMVKISAGEKENMTKIIQSVICNFDLQACSAEKVCACILENCLE